MKLLVDPLRNKWAFWNFSILAFLNGWLEPILTGFDWLLCSPFKFDVREK